MDDSSGPPPDLAERNRRALEANGMNAELYFTVHDEYVVSIKHAEDGLFYRPRYVQRRDVEEEHWMILYEDEDRAEFVSTLRDFFGYMEVNGERVGCFTVVEAAPPERRRPSRAK